MISALIVNYRSQALTVRAAASVLADVADAQVIVVDNSESPGEAAALARTLPAGVELIVSPRNLGFGRACNLALQSARHPWVLLLNPDATVVPGCLPRLLGFLQARPDAGAVSPTGYWDAALGWRLPPGQMPTPRAEFGLSLALRWPWLGQIVSKAFRRWALGCLVGGRAAPQRMLSGGHMLLRRSAIDAAGGLFDPAFFLYYEDTDLCRRLRRAGFGLYLLPDAGVVHAWRCEPAKAALSQPARAYYLRKHFAASPWAACHAWLERRFPHCRLPSSDSLGVLDGPPAFAVPADWTTAWTLEISPQPLFVPAAYHKGEGPRAVVPEDIWRLLGPGEYWARIQPVFGRGECRFHWQIPPRALPVQAQADVLDRLAATVPQLPCGAELPASALPAHAGPLAARFGLEHDEASGRWRKLRQPRWQLGWAREKDYPAWSQLFRAAFGHELPATQWAWKYAGADPIGSAVHRGGEMVAFYGGMPRGIRYFGQPTQAVQIGDVMAHPSERGILTRNGPFQLAAATFLEHGVGYGRPYTLAFGFPNRRALRLGERLGLYAQVDELEELRWEAASHVRGWRSRARPVTARDERVVDALWVEMAAAFKDAILCERSWRVISHRYLGHPVHRYSVLLARARFSRKPLGVVVLRDHGDEGIELLDLVASPARFPTLIDVARRFAAGLGRQGVFAWITASHAHLLDSSIAARRSLDIGIPCNIWTLGPPADELRGRWWLMSGDTDFR